MLPTWRSVAAFIGSLSITWAMAQQPTPCALVVPAVVGSSVEAVPTTCPCRVTAFKATVYNRWAVEVWSTDSIATFPGGMLGAQDLAGGTYLWKVKYTAIATGDAVEQERTGYVNVVK
ncbi:MAG: hypothetical protein IPO05_14745 [Flavobacteriales bacterium]|nr:hypothetical protein [Flavobacteriales bacterium]